MGTFNKMLATCSAFQLAGELTHFNSSSWPSEEGAAHKHGGGAALETANFDRRLTGANAHDAHPRILVSEPCDFSELIVKFTRPLGDKFRNLKLHIAGQEIKVKFLKTKF